jgi:hypothetical protein
MRNFFRNHALSIVMLGLFFLAFLVGQVITGRNEYNEERHKHGEAEVNYGEYLKTGHFAEATAENWESEFLQMFVYVLGTAFLYQKGSAESKDPRKHHAHKSSRAVTPDSPWPARRGGWVLRIYEHSLSGALFLLFLIAFTWHARGGLRHYNEERLHDGEPIVGLSDYMTSSRFWFEAFQNWQSEFLAIGVMVLLTIWLREMNSPESKQVQTPHWENEE